MVHELKIKKKYLEAILIGDKRFEVRKNDRDYEVGDILCFQEKFSFKIMYIHKGLGLRKGYVCMSIRPVRLDGTLGI